MKRDGCLRRGKQPDGSAITGVMKLGCVFTQHVTGAEGKPPRDPEPRVGKDSTSPARPSRRVAPARRRAGSRCRSRTRRLSASPGVSVSRQGGHAAAMLILSRKVGRSIVIDRNVIVKVVWVDGDQIKLGIDAPKAISVHREEAQRERDAWVPAPSGSVTRGCLHPDRHLR